MDTLRLEKGYRHFGHDVGDEDHVLEAGLGFAVKTGKPEGRFGPFIGREAVLRQRAAGLQRRLLQVRLHDAEPLLLHAEPIICEGRIAGYLSSGGYGHTIGSAVGMGYAACEAGMSVIEQCQQRFEIEVAGQRFAASVSTKPFYDPDGKQIRS
jgi:4-methylaminobutanoate oxidase (formaldehyde-forming)